MNINSFFIIICKAFLCIFLIGYEVYPGSFNKNDKPLSLYYAVDSACGINTRKMHSLSSANKATGLDIPCVERIYSAQSGTYYPTY